MFQNDEMNAAVQRWKIQQEIKQELAETLYCNFVVINDFDVIVCKVVVIDFDMIVCKVAVDDVGDEKNVKVGDPIVKGAKVEGEIVEQTRAKKVVGVKHKAKKRQLKKFGHKQHLTKVKITKIS